MGRKAANLENPNISHIRVKNKWRIGDCLACGKTGIRSKDWKLHEVHTEVSQSECTANIHKKLVTRISNKISNFLQVSLYEGLQQTFPSGISLNG